MPPQQHSLPRTGSAAVSVGWPEGSLPQDRSAILAMAGRVTASGAHLAIMGDGSL
ncbi:hypothetical protein ABZ595_14665 [Streptomyces rubradiris]|uniref:hypothetical protein n=1 Tax=Streptomyces rubradiris TaxID=285531 RepID=UPI0033D4A6E2